jgi:photosystem II stability/assembly factor-like uncharacterized protein
MRLALNLLLVTVCAAQTWVGQNSGTNASLRGVSAVDAKIVWASGTGGTYLKTTDGGESWNASKVPGAEELDFRDVEAFDAGHALLLSIGPGEKSRIYRTADGGAHWDLAFTNPDAKGFFDCMAFWDAQRGIIVGDPVDGHFGVFTTNDGGDHWQRRTTPDALPGEGAFAASGTCVITGGKQDAWFVTGGPKAARVFHATDGGATWTVASTPVRNDGPSAGIFSLGFSDARHGVAVGGDYNKPDETTRNLAVTSDGGRTWTVPVGSPPAGFRSAVTYVPKLKLWMTVGTSGSDASSDGVNWKRFDTGAFNATSFAASGDGWAVGSRGRVARFHR